MKRTLLVAVGLAFGSLLAASTAVAQVGVNGYMRRDGTYVQPYTRSRPDNTVTNNYSYRGNANPYTGATGDNDYRHSQSSPYYTGPSTNSQSNYGGGSHLNNDSYGLQPYGLGGRR